MSYRDRDRGRGGDGDRRDRGRFDGNVPRSGYDRERESNRLDRTRDFNNEDYSSSHRRDRDRDRDDHGDRDDRSRSRDRNYSRYDRKRGRSPDRDQPRRNQRDTTSLSEQPKKKTSDSKDSRDNLVEGKSENGGLGSTNKTKENKVVDSETIKYDDKEMQELQRFMATEEGSGDEDNSVDSGDTNSEIKGVEFETEEEIADRLAQERKRRREEIQAKYSKSKTSEDNEVIQNDINKDSNVTENKPEVRGRSESRSEDVDQAGHRARITSDSPSRPLAALCIQHEDETNTTSSRPIFLTTDKNLGDDSAQENGGIALFAKDNTKSNARGSVFDIFSDSPTAIKDSIISTASGVPTKLGDDSNMDSNWNDSEGYYLPQIGELVLERYRTLGVVGKGVFSCVLKCIDTSIIGHDSSDDKESGKAHVAIKVIRNNDTMKKAAQKELAILEAIRENDPLDRCHCVKLLASAEVRAHAAIIFEFQDMNLREALKKFGKDVGINIQAVRLYARQLFSALNLLAKLKVVHADIKLDNILCSADCKRVKLCDFGSAFRESDYDNAPTPYLVSRFYRAPEIVLGLYYDKAIDMWSVAVCLYELFTGRIMFPGRTNNEMLRLYQLCRGRLSNKIIKSHLRAYSSMELEPHFQPEDLRFKQLESDAFSGRPVVRLVDMPLQPEPQNDLTQTLKSCRAAGDDGKLVSLLADLLGQCLHLDPLRRISIESTIKHGFLSSSTPM